MGSSEYATRASSWTAAGGRISSRIPTLMEPEDPCYRRPRRARGLGRDAVSERAGHARRLHREGQERARRTRRRRRDRRRRQRIDRRMSGDREEPRRARDRRPRTRVRKRADERHRGLARALRHHGRRRRQLRLPRGAAFRRQAARRARPGAGLPPALGRWTHPAGCHAVPAPLVRKPAVLEDGAGVVPRAHPRRLLRPAGLQEGALRAPQPEVHGHGVRDRDDRQVEPVQGGHRRGPDHAPPGRPQGPRSAPEDVPRRLADAALPS